MTKLRIASLLTIVTISILTVGCKGTARTSLAEEQEPSAITNPSSSGTKTTSVSNSQIEGGIITSPVTISVATKGNESESELKLEAGTKFKDADGNVLEKVFPKFELGQATGNSNATESVQTKINLTDAQGNKIIPTEAVTLKVKAPGNAKPGDEVRISVPEGVSKSTKQEKLLILIVGADGTVSLTLLPDVFKNNTVVVIIIEKKTIVTGAEGGN